MADSEFYNFLSNFLLLLNTGKSAQLVFECQEGQARVHLHHALHLRPHPESYREHEHRYYHHHQRPSRLRRRVSRALARAAATAANDDKPVNEDASKIASDAVKASVSVEVAEKASQVNLSSLALQKRSSRTSSTLSNS